MLRQGRYRGVLGPGLHFRWPPPFEQLVRLTPSPSDRRATDAALTDAGHSALLAATPAHADFIRTIVFHELDPGLLPPLRAALGQVHEQLLAHATLPHPGPPQTRLAGLRAGD